MRIPFGERIRDLIALHDGTIALLTDNSGHLVILDDGGPVYQPVDDGGEVRGADENPGVVRWSDQAGEGLFQRPIGGAEGYRYSYELAVVSDMWAEERLERFLIDPDREFPGVRMQKSTLAAPELDSIVAYLHRRPSQ